MADISDVENALVALIAGALFPSSVYQPGSYSASAALAIPLPSPSALAYAANVAGWGGASIVGMPGGYGAGSIKYANPALVQPLAPSPVAVKLYRGWPETASLNADLALSFAHVSVFSDPNTTRNVSRWQPTPVVTIPPNLTVTMAASGLTITIGGTPTQGNVISFQCGLPLTDYAYMLQQSDNLTSAAAALAAKFSGATSFANVITLPSSPASATLNLAVGAMAPETIETITRQQQQTIRISVWAPTPLARDAVASLIDNAIAGLTNQYGNLTQFLPVTPYDSAHIVYRSTYVNDIPGRDRVWRRDMCYMVEYPTTLIQLVPFMLSGGGTETIGLFGATKQLGAIAPS